MRRVGINSVILGLIFLAFVRKGQSLFKNCVTPAEWDNDTSNAPRCELLYRPRLSHVTCYGDGQVSINRLSPAEQRMAVNVPRILCTAPYPMDVDVVGFKTKGQPPILFLRQADEPIQISSTLTSNFTYSILLPLMSNVWSPRLITFRGISFPELRTEFYLYYPGGNDRALPFDWPNEKNIPTIVEPESQYAVLPCQVTHFDDKILLKKVGPDGEDLVMDVDNSLIRFEPRYGFILDTEGIPQPWGVYICHAINPRKSKSDLETLQVRLRKPRDFIPTPNLSNVDAFDGDDLVLNCKSKTRISMYGTIDGKAIPDSSFVYRSNATYRIGFSAQFEYDNVQHGNAGSVSCADQDGNRHTWKFTIWDLEDNDLLQLRNNGTEVSCKSNASTYVTLFNGECINEAHCRSRKQAIDTFGSGQCDLVLTKVVECGSPCNREPRRNGKCLDPMRSRRFGVYRCETDFLTHSVTYFQGYDGLIYTNPKLDRIPPEALIKITIPHETLHTEVINTFKCQASSFVSNGNYTWLLRRPNGTTFLPYVIQERVIHDFIKNDNSIWEADIVFTEPIKDLEVICLVPIWDSWTGWLNYSVVVTVTVPMRPRIDQNETSVSFFIGDKNRNLPCKAAGRPVPKIQWFKDGKVVNISDTDEEGVILVFPEIHPNLGGTYTCLARNSAGNDSVNFEIKVEEKPDITVYVVIGVILLILLTVTLVVLYWKLLKAKNEIRNLSDEEVHEFLHGNPEAAKAAKEPHEVIMYLPFNPEYEIEKDRLVFDEHDVLGSGAFGLVLRGKLAGYHEEVAIKTLKPFSAISYFKALLSELKIMVYIGKHENVVNLIGAYTGKIKERILYMVVELSPYGSLEDYLRNNQKNFLNQMRNDKICIPKGDLSQLYANINQDTVDNAMYMNTLCTADLVSMAHQIAEGMNHLASKKVIHADLAARNVLLYHNGVVKITDFGLSRQLYAYTSYMKKEQEPLPWRSMAIESLREMNFSTQSDVWAYGVTLWEVFSLGAVPYPGLSWSIDFVDKLSHGLRLSKPQYASTEIYEIMIQCWHYEPDQRPSFEQLRNVFLNMRTTIAKLCGVNESTL